MRMPTVRDIQVAVAARFTDEEFGYERWKADQVGRGDRPGVLLLFDSERERDSWLAEHGGEC